MMLVAGEALFDVFVGEPTATGFVMEARLGGSPFNVAVGVARLGQPVGFLGAVGAGRLGDRLVEALAAEGVDTAAVQRPAAPTTLGLVALDPRGVAEYAFYGEGAADRALAAPPPALLAGVQALHVGSYATVVGDTARTLAECVATAPATCLVSYDPNVRLNVASSLEAWRERLAWMLPRTQLLKISEEDLALLEPGTSPEAFLAGCLAHGVRLAIVTRGGDGAVGACVAGSAVVPSCLAGPLVDTVGAGDTYQAALLVWLAERQLLSRDGVGSLGVDQLTEAMVFAARAAGITCSRRGADLPRRDELPAAGVAVA